MKWTAILIASFFAGITGAAYWGRKALWMVALIWTIVLLLSMHGMAMDLKLEGEINPEGLVAFQGKLYPPVLVNAQEAAREPDGIKFRHATGVTFVPYEILPGRLRETWKFTREEITEYRAKRHASSAAAAKAAYEAGQKASEDRKAKWGENTKLAALTSEDERLKLKERAPSEIRRLEDEMANIINTYAARRESPTNNSPSASDLEKAKLIRRGSGWWPCSPVGHKDLGRSFRGKELMEEHGYWLSVLDGGK